MVREYAAVLALLLLLLLQQQQQQQQQCTLLLPSMALPWPVLDQLGQTLAGMARRCGHSGLTSANALVLLLLLLLLVALFLSPLRLLQVLLSPHYRQLTLSWHAHHLPVVTHAETAQH
jgi:hypothetical protein